jgi:hypothetical protein
MARYTSEDVSTGVENGHQKALKGVEDVHEVSPYSPSTSAHSSLKVH